MSYFQATAYKPYGGLSVDRPIAGLGRTCKLLHRHSSGSCKLQEQVYPRVVLIAACHKRLGPVYASSGNENRGLVNDPFSMESLNKAIAGAKKPWSIQDFMLEQMAKIRGQGPGGNGGKNRYGGNGGGSDGPEDRSFKESLYEMIQILLATVAFILMYIHIIRGEELYRLARDYTRYLITGKRTARLKRAVLNWRDFSEGIKKDSAQEDSNEGPIASGAMWWEQPQKFVHRIEELCRGYLSPRIQEP